MKIYTRSGDGGETGLLGSVRVSKSHLAIETCGTVDELNCHLGCVITLLGQSESDHADGLVTVLLKIQSELFDLGSRVAGSLASDPKTAPVAHAPDMVGRLESWIDQYDSFLPPLQNFILPGGSPVGSQLHLARTVCRRCERRLFSLIESEIKQDLSRDLVYLNRLGDLLFVLARYGNQMDGASETPWLPPT